MGAVKKIGVVSDTHGFLSPGLQDILAQCDLIIHAGDMDDAHTLGQFRAIGPPCRIARGNCDYGAWAETLSPVEFFEFAGFHFYVRHIPWQVDIDPVAAGVDVVISGHTHRARTERENGVLFLNPGSAGAVPASQNATAALITIDNKDVLPEIITLAPV